MDMMKKALENRRGRGLDIAIVLGGGDPVNSEAPVSEQEEVDNDLAPEVSSEGPAVTGEMVDEVPMGEEAPFDMGMLAKLLGKGSIASKIGKK